MQSYPLPFGDGNFPPQDWADEWDTLGFMYGNKGDELMDSVYYMNETFLHADGSLLLEFGVPAPNQPDEDESWGIGGCRIYIQGATIKLYNLYLPVLFR